MARVRAALRNRIGRRSEPLVVRIGGVEIDNLRHRVTRGDKEVRLTPKEFELFAPLAQHAGAVVTDSYILTAIWGPGDTSTTWRENVAPI
jgi:two-component system, OmpR family, KDP operon response regulator KdpE